MARTRNRRDRRHRWKLGLAGCVLVCIALGVQGGDGEQPPDRGDPDPELPLRSADDLGASRYDGHLDQSRRRDPLISTQGGFTSPGLDSNQQSSFRSREVAPQA